MAEILDDNSSSDNLTLYPEDRLIILSQDEDRAAQIAGVIAELKSQATQQESAPVVEVHGLVRFPGEYPLENSMEVEDLIQAAGGLRENAYLEKMELTRREVVNGEYREISHQEIEPSMRAQLQPFDSLQIKQIPLWAESKTVTIQGEVQFPGSYVLSRGETLKQLLKRVGGFTDEAFLGGAIFLREDLRKREKEEMIKVADQLEKQLVMSSIEESGEEKKTNESDVVMVRELVAKLRETPAAGRLAIDLTHLMENKESDLVLKDGDRLFISAISQEVTVLGEVFHPSSHFHQANLTRLDYVNFSGGPTKLADLDNVYVVRANGKVLAAKRIAWFRAMGEEIHPGDSVVVPLDVKPTTFMADMMDISQILFQLATTVAALDTVGAL